MENRRIFLGQLSVLLAMGTRLPERDVPQASVRTLGQYPLSGPFDGLEATLVEVTAPPGRGSPAHRHPGFVLGYVLEGELRFRLNQESERIVRAGETFYEPPDAVHAVSASAAPDRSVKFLAFLVANKGSPLTLPA